MALLNRQRRNLLKWAVFGLGLAVLGKKFVLDDILSARTENSDPESQRTDFHHLSAALLGLDATTLDKQVSDPVWIALSAHAPFRRDLFLLVDEYKGARKNQSTFNQTKEFSAPRDATIKTVLRTWYTGVVEFSDGETSGPAKRLFYEESRMFDFFKTLRPSPGNCFGELGYWSKRPM